MLFVKHRKQNGCDAMQDYPVVKDMSCIFSHVNRKTQYEFPTAALKKSSTAGEYIAQPWCGRRPALGEQKGSLDMSIRRRWSLFPGSIVLIS